MYVHKEGLRGRGALDRESRHFMIAVLDVPELGVSLPSAWLFWLSQVTLASW